MTSRPERAWGAALAAAAFALALAGCVQPPPGRSGAEIRGSEAVVALVGEAREAMGEGDLAGAGRLLDEARALEPENPAVWVSIARLRFRGGEQIAAIEAADRALALDRAHGPALLMRAQLVRDAHGFRAARSWYEAALAADPGNPEIRLDHAATLGEGGEYRAMLAALERIDGDAAEGARAQFLRAVLAARAGDNVLARSLLARSGLVQENVPAALLLDGLIDLAQGNRDSAAAKLADLAGRQPGNARAADLHARALWQGRRDRELVDLHATRARRDDASPYLSMLVGRAYERLGERAAAAPFLERAAAGPSGEAALLASDDALPEPTARIRALLAAETKGQARSGAEALRARYPASSDVGALAGDVALATGDPAEALARYRDAALVRRSWPLAKKAIIAYRAVGDEDAAEVLLSRHVAGEPANAEALAMLAAASARREDWLRAKLLVDRAISLGGGSDPALLRLRARAAEALGEEGAARFEARAEALAPRGFANR
jgi:Tfp pilus assembly protein PilF